MIGASMAVRPPRSRGPVLMMIDALRRIGGSLWMVDNAFSGAFVDNLGTTPVTAYADLLGLTTDRLGVLGPNVFSDATSCTFAGESVRVSSGVYRIYSSAGVYSAVSISGGLQQNKTYRLRFYQDNAIAGALAIDGPVGSVVPVVAGGVGWKECIVTMTSVVSLTIKRSSAATDIQISNVLIQELTGNHATQSAVASKPSVRRVPKRLGPNLVSNGTFDSGTTGWSAANGGGISASGGELVVTNISANAGRGTQSFVTEVGKSYVLTAQARIGTSTQALVGLGAASGSVGLGVVSTTSATLAQLSLPFVATVATTFVSVSLGTSTIGHVSYFDNIAVQEVLEWANVISFDGNNDFLQTGITTGNEGWMAAGVTFADANVTFFSSGTTAANAGVWLYRNVGGAKSMNIAVANGSAIAYSPNIIPPTNTPVVVSGGWTATTVFAGVDHTETSTSSRSGASASALPLRLGIATEASYPLNGHMHAIAYTPVLPDAATRKIIRDGIAALQGRGPL